MSAKDKYHDTVVKALQKDGWTILKEQYRLVLENRRAWIDIRAAKQQGTIIFLEVKSFENIPSQVTPVTTPKKGAFGFWGEIGLIHQTPTIQIVFKCSGTMYCALLNHKTLSVPISEYNPKNFYVASIIGFLFLHLLIAPALQYPFARYVYRVEYTTQFLTC